MSSTDPTFLPTPSFLPPKVRNKDIMLRSIEGQSPEEIASYYNLTPEGVRQILSSPLVKSQMLEYQERLHKPVLEAITSRGVEAVELVTDVMRGEVTSELRLKAAKDLLDRNPEVAKPSTGVRELGEGLGEAIIRELTRQEKAREIDITPTPTK